MTINKSKAEYGPATVPLAGQEIDKIVVEGEMSSGDEYLSEFVETEVTTQNAVGMLDKNVVTNSELKDRLNKSGL